MSTTSIATVEPSSSVKAIRAPVPGVEAPGGEPGARVAVATSRAGAVAMFAASGRGDTGVAALGPPRASTRGELAHAARTIATRSDRATHFISPITRGEVHAHGSRATELVVAEIASVDVQQHEGPTSVVALAERKSTRQRRADGQG